MEFIKAFQLAQLLVEYLLKVQDALVEKEGVLKRDVEGLHRKNAQLEHEYRLLKKKASVIVRRGWDREREIGERREKKVEERRERAHFLYFSAHSVTYSTLMNLTNRKNVRHAVKAMRQSRSSHNTSAH